MVSKERDIKNIKSYMERNYFLILQIVKRDIWSKYKGSYLGIVWAVLVPLLMLLVFTFVFNGIFQAKWGNKESLSKMDFSLNLFIGLSIFWFVADYISRAPTFFTSVPNYIKKVIFPLEVLPVAYLLSSLFNLFIYFILIVAIVLFSRGSVPVSIIALPIVIVSILPMLYGAGLFLASVSVYVRDLTSIIGVLINLLMFLSPIFYPLSAINGKYRWLFELNPLSLIIEECRKIVMQGKWPDVKVLTIYVTISCISFFIGYRVFVKTREGFADVL